MIRTRANIASVSRNAAFSMLSVNRDVISCGNDQGDLLGTVSVNLRVLADAIDEERTGRDDFFGCLPSDGVAKIVDMIREGA